jgi:hypothetical protein
MSASVTSFVVAAAATLAVGLLWRVRPAAETGADGRMA